MKIGNLLQDVLVEEVKNKKLFNDLLTKWRVQKPDLTPDYAETLYNRFQEIKNGLSPNKAQVTSFLYRFDGRHGYEKFDPDLLKDITKYSYRQIKSLIDEYSDDELGGIDPGELNTVFDPKNLKATPEKIEASKQLWENGNAIVDVDGLKVYDILNQAMAVRYGYYLEQIRRGFSNEFGTNSRWCVTWRGTREEGDGGTNMWSSYRTQGKTFYFVIDLNKDTKDRYYMSALERYPASRDGYILTSIKNDGDQSMSWEEVCRIYPKLTPFKDKITPRNYSEDETEEKSIVGQINEMENNQYEFKRVDRQLKKAYINNQGVIKKAHSWAVMDDKLRALYILTTTEQQIRNKFSNFELINEIRKVGNEFTLLDNRIKQLGHRDGVGFILTDLIKHEFRLTRESLNNPQIKIYESRQTGLFGVFSDKTATWVKLDGKVYEPMFKQTESDVFFDEEEMGYYVEKYENRQDGLTFYSIFPSDTEKGDCYLLSQKKWEELKPRLYVDKESVPRLQDFNKDTDVDIKEIKKGV